MLKGDKQLSTSLHFINDSTIDTGRVIAKSMRTMQQGNSYLWHVPSLHTEGCELILQAVNTLDKCGGLSAQVSANGGQYYAFLDQAELR